MFQNIPKTELLYQKSKPVDHLSISDGISLMIQEQKNAALEVKKASKSINLTTNKIYEHLMLNLKGRLIYVGAGTSGRIGVQDGVELFPTFNWPKKRLDFIIAGGKRAVLNAVENAEDDIIKAKEVVSKKLVNYYLENFKNKIHFHDKVEFKILFTCFNFETNKRVNKLLNNFTLNEKKLLISSLKNITKLTINNTYKEIKLIEELERKQKIIDKKNIYWLDKIFWLVQDCKKLGTISFAGLARAGFVAIDILNSLENENIITQNDKNNFLNSINTILSDLKKDHLKMSKDNFLKKYGHLRPNTYEISSKNYRDGYKLYFNKKNKHNLDDKKITQFNINKNTEIKINNFLNKNNLQINCAKLFNWMKISIENREYSKFVFTKSIDLIFKYIKRFAKRNNIPPEDLSYLKIGDFLNFYYNLELESVGKKLSENIKLNKKNYNQVSEINLPNIILSHKDIYIKEEDEISVNFIGSKISGPVIELKKIQSINLKKKIVCIESADPGYDFIFSNNIKGLITKYGGANSHMAIRCHELNIAAAIGVGEELYNKITNLKFVTIDSLSKKIF